MNQKHIFYYKILRPLLILFSKIGFGYKGEKPNNLPEQYIVLANHTTDFDPIFMVSSFPRQMYFVASEHITHWGFLSKIIMELAAPIVRYKGSVAASTVMDVLRKIKKGANVCIFAEGDRSWDGVSGPILDSTSKLIQSSGCGLVTYRLIGGYFVSPRWSTHLRRGPLRGEVAGIYTKEQLSAMSALEIQALIVNDLYEDAYQTQKISTKKYQGRALAEGLEHLFFICPECTSHDTLSSKKHTFTCEKCGHTLQYNPFGMLQGGNFETITQFSDWQKVQVKNDILSNVTYHIPRATLCEITHHQKTLIAAGAFCMNKSGIQHENHFISIEEISNMAIYGKNTLVFSAGKTYYELKPEKGLNGIKFLLYYHAAQA